jgi:hypothetical protein
VNGQYYQRPTRQVGQGDILVDVASLRLTTDEFEFIRRRNGARGPIADIYPYGGPRTPTQQHFNPNADEAIVPVQVARGMIMSNACDWDNSATAPVLIALVRPLEFLPADAQEHIRQGRNGRYLHLPENDEPQFEESYVDFARMTSVRVTALASHARLLSPNERLLAALYIGLTYFFSRCEPASDLVTDAVRRALDQAN